MSIVPDPDPADGWEVPRFRPIPFADFVVELAELYQPPSGPRRPGPDSVTRWDWSPSWSDRTR